MNAEWLENLLKNALIIDVGGANKYPVRFVATLIGINQSALRRSLQSEDRISKFRAYLADASFDLAELDNWRRYGIPENALVPILRYYALEAARFKTRKAKIIYDLLVELN